MKKQFVFLLAVVEVLFLSCQSEAKIEYRAPYSKTGCVVATEKLLKRLSETLPQGWQADKKYSSVIVSRKEVVYVDRQIFSELVREDDPYRDIRKYAFPEAFIINIEINDLVSPAEYKKIKSQNDEIIKIRDNFQENMRHFRSSKGDQYLPMTDADRKIFGEYKKLLSELEYHQLPAAYDEINSYYITVNIPPYMVFFDFDVVKECKEVLGMVLSRMNIYEETERDVLLDDIFKSQRPQDQYYWYKNDILRGRY